MLYSIGGHCCLPTYAYCKSHAYLHLLERARIASVRVALQRGGVLGDQLIVRGLGGGRLGGQLSGGGDGGQRAEE